MIFFEKHGVDENEFFQVIPLMNYHFPLHFHRAYELIFINEGQLLATVNQKEYQLQKHDMVFIFPHEIHEFKTIDYSEITIVLFSPELVGDFYMNYKHYIPDDNILRFSDNLDFKNYKTMYGQKSFLYGICDSLIKEKTFSEVKQTPQTKVLYKILQYVEENYASDCTLKTVAKYLQYDYPYISKLFVRLMNMTFTEYLNQYRISQACYLLNNKNYSVSEIANNCGYNNLRSFHRNFREITGKPPKLYRIKH